MSEPAGRVGRSLLLIGLSYPLLSAGLLLLLVGTNSAGVTLTICGTFLIGVTEILFYLDRTRPPMNDRP